MGIMVSMFPILGDAGLISSAVVLGYGVSDHRGLWFGCVTLGERIDTGIVDSESSILS